MRWVVGLLAINAILATWGLLPTAIAPTEPRGRVCLNGEWRLESLGGNVRVPEMPDPVATGRRRSVYRRAFTVPAEWTDGASRVLLRFDKAQHYARVLVNGMPVGEHFGSRVGFDLDVTEAVRPGANEVEARVESLSEGRVWKGVFTRDMNAYRLYATNVFKRTQAYIGGDVWLERRPPVSISEPYVVTSVAGESLTVRLKITNPTSATVRRSVHATAWLDGRVARSMSTGGLSIPPGQTVEATLETPWRDPVLWGPPGYGSPTLYTLVADLRDGSGRLADRIRTRFGFREIGFEGRTMTLNGKPIFLMATRIQEEPRTDGTDERHRLRAAIAEWQRLGFNAVESHNESRPGGFYDIADETGMLVISGTFCSGRVFNKARGRRDPAGLRELSLDMERWCVAERNHPSIVMWNVCDMNPELHEALFSRVARADATRLLPNISFRFVPLEVDGALTPRDPSLVTTQGLPVFISETFLPRGTRKRPLDRLDDYLALLVDRGAFGATIPCEYAPAEPARKVRGVAWPSSSGLDPRGAFLRVSSKDRVTGPPELLITGAAPGAIVWASPEGREDLRPLAVTADEAGKALLYLDAPGVWRVRSGDGKELLVRAEAMVVAAGQEPAFPTVDLR